MINVDVEFIVNDLINCLLIIWYVVLLLLDYILFVEYNLTLSGCSVDHRVIYLNGVGDLQDWDDCIYLMLEDYLGCFLVLSIFLKFK